MTQQPHSGTRSHALADAPTRPLPAPPDLILAPPGRRGRGWLTALLLLVFLGLLALLAAVGGVAWYWQSDLIMPGVTVLGESVGGQTVDEAAATLAVSWARRAIVMETDTGDWVVSPETLGIYFDARATAERAQATGRSPQSLADLRGPLRDGAAVIPVWRIDLAATEANLQAAGAQFAVPAVDARLEMGAGGGRVVPALPGSEIDVAATVDWLAANAAQAVLQGRAPLAIRPTEPTVTAAALGPLAQRLNSWLQTSVTLVLSDPVLDEQLDIHAGAGRLESVAEP